MASIFVLIGGPSHLRSHMSLCDCLCDALGMMFQAQTYKKGDLQYEALVLMVSNHHLMLNRD